jgi:hypothetical protein
LKNCCVLNSFVLDGETENMALPSVISVRSRSGELDAKCDKDTACQTI